MRLINLPIGSNPNDISCRNRKYKPIGLVNHLALQRHLCDMHTALYYYLYCMYGGESDTKNVSIENELLCDSIHISYKTTFAQ